jgi:hypothetical protein
MKTYQDYRQEYDKIIGEWKFATGEREKELDARVIELVKQLDKCLAGSGARGNEID